DLEHRDFIHLDLHWLQLDRYILPRQFVRPLPRHLLGRHGRRRLQELATEPVEQQLQPVSLDRHLHLRPQRFPRTALTIPRPPNPDYTFVDLVAPGVDLRQPCRASDHQRQYARRDRVECAEVADLFDFGDTAHLTHHIMRGPSFGFIDYDRSVHGSLSRDSPQ